MTAKPWIKWYFADFAADPKLRFCCRAARSFWHDMLRLMNEAEPYGHLIFNGQTPTIKELASSLGDPERDAAKWLTELERHGVFSRTPAGVIYSRRMVRDHAKAERDKANGKIGGNPFLKAKGNLGVNPDHKTQKSDIRYQNQKPEATPQAASAAGGPLDLKKELWARGVAYLKTQGQSEQSARQILGRWRKSYDDLAIINAMAAAEAATAPDPIPYITAVLARKGNQNGARQPGRSADNSRAFTDGLLEFGAEDTGPTLRGETDPKGRG